MKSNSERPRQVDVVFAKPFRIRPLQDVLVTCLSGVAWVTRDGVDQDAILSEGDALHISAREDPLVVGMPACSVKIAVAPRR